MYQGENQTALESQKQIRDAFLGLMHEKQYDSICVKEICERANVSRQTFYSLFKTKENVILHLMKCTCTRPKDEEVEQCFSIDEFSISFADFIYVNFDFFQLLIAHDLYPILYRSIYTMFQCCQENQDTMYRFMTGGLTGFISGVVTDDTNKDKAYLTRMIQCLFLGDYFKQ